MAESIFRPTITKSKRDLILFLINPLNHMDQETSKNSYKILVSIAFNVVCLIVLTGHFLQLVKFGYQLSLLLKITGLIIFIYVINPIHNFRLVLAGTLGISGVLIIYQESIDFLSVRLNSANIPFFPFLLKLIIPTIFIAIYVYEIRKKDDKEEQILGQHESTPFFSIGIDRFKEEHPEDVKPFLKIRWPLFLNLSAIFLILFLNIFNWNNSEFIQYSEIFSLSIKQLAGGFMLAIFAFWSGLVSFEYSQENSPIGQSIFKYIEILSLCGSYGLFFLGLSHLFRLL